MFTRVKPFDWVEGELLTSDQQNQLDADHAKAIDGTGGGTYNVAEDLSLQPVASKTVVIGTATFPSVADGGGLDLGGENITDVDQLVCSGISVSGPIAGASCSVGTLAVGGNAALGDSSGDTLSIPANTTHTGPTTFNGSVNLVGATTLTGRITPTGTGRYLQRVLNVLADADGSVGPGTYDVVLVQSGVLTTTRNLTIDDSAVGGYEAIAIEMLDATHSYVIKHPTSLATLVTMKNASGFANWARIRAVGVGTYAVVAKYVVP